MRELLEDKTVYARMANAVNPYGDGTASRKIVDILAEAREENDSGQNSCL